MENTLASNYSKHVEFHKSELTHFSVRLIVQLSKSVMFYVGNAKKALNKI